MFQRFLNFHRARVASRRVDGFRAHRERAALGDVRSFVSARAPRSPAPQRVKPKHLWRARIKRGRGHNISTFRFDDDDN
jgi:hypothetical protein